MCPSWKKFEESQLKGVRGVDYIKCTVYEKTCWKNDQVQLYINFSKKVRTLPNSNMLIFNMSITTVQSLSNVSLKV
jgi:hypothetical protein